MSGGDIGIQFGTTPEQPQRPDRQTIIAKVRLPDENAYKGEFGFDWMDLDPDTTAIKAIQGVDFGYAEHYYREPLTSSPEDLGSIQSVSGNEKEVKDSVLKHYHTLRVGYKYVDLPYILMRKGEEYAIELLLQIECLSGELEGSESILIQGNEHYEVEIIGGAKAGNITRIPLTSKEAVFGLKITCHDYSAKEEPLHIMLEKENGIPERIGGVVMMENVPLQLNFRLIALVSNEGDTQAKARGLFNDFKKKDIIDYLNNNSLNQAGYEVILNNKHILEQLDTVDLEPYIYAFDKAGWQASGSFKEKHPVEKVIGWERNEDGSLKKDENDKYIPIKEIEYKDILSKNNSSDPLDIKTIMAYRNYVKLKYGEIYKDGLIILSDYDCEEGELAYSRVNPLSYYAVYIFANIKNDSSKSTYPHEIGHMLGLPHIFATDEALPFIKMIDAEVTQYKLNISNTKPYNTSKRICCKKNELKKALEKFNLKYKKNNEYNIAKSINERALTEIDSKMLDDYYPFTSSAGEVYVLREDYIKLFEDYLNYARKLVAQRKKHIIYFKQSKTSNVMDYYNYYKDLFFNSFQIKIMRCDYENYY